MVGFCEKFSVKSRFWAKVPEMEFARLNCASCTCGEDFVYAFGGMDEEEHLLKNIERFNKKLGVWRTLNVELSSPMSNLFAHSLNSENIVLLGGMKKV